MSARPNNNRNKRNKPKKGSKEAGKQPEGSMTALVRAQGQIISSLSQEARKSQQALDARNVAINAQQQSVKKRMDKLTPYDIAWLQQMLLPEMVRSGSAILSPSMSPARAHAAHFRLEHILEGPIVDNTTVSVKPSIYPVSVSIQAPITSSDIDIRGEIDPNGNFTGEYYEGDANGSTGLYELNVHGHTAEYNGKSSIITNFNNGDVLDMNFKDFPTGTYDIWFYDSVALSWLNMGTLTNTQGTQAFTATSSISAIAIAAHDPGSFVPGPAGGVIQNNTTVFTFTTPTTHYPVKLKIPASSESYRITALSAKLTFFGADIYNQGGCAGARVYPKWTPYSGGLAGTWDSIAQLPVNSFDGRIDKGLHAYWIPIDVKEYDFKDPNGDLVGYDLSKLWFVVKDLDQNASLRIELDAVVEFYSPEPVFSHDPVPYLSDKYGEMLFYLGMQPCIGDNPGHFERLTKVAKTVAKGVSAAGQIASLFL